MEKFLTITSIGSSIFTMFNIKALIPVKPYNLADYTNVIEFFISKERINIDFKAEGEDEIDTGCGLYKAYLEDKKEIYLCFNKNFCYDDKILMSIMMKKGE